MLGVRDLNTLRTSLRRISRSTTPLRRLLNVKMIMLPAYKLAASKDLSLGTSRREWITSRILGVKLLSKISATFLQCWEKPPWCSSSNKALLRRGARRPHWPAKTQARTGCFRKLFTFLCQQTVLTIWRPALWAKYQLALGAPCGRLGALWWTLWAIGWWSRRNACKGLRPPVSSLLFGIRAWRFG